jgi:hypothetical protein
MHPRLRFWLIVALAVTLGLVVSFGLAQETYALAGLLVAMIGWLLLEWAGGPRPEAWLLAAVLVGYVLGNRGFAQLSLMRELPLLPAETALLAGVAATLLRMAFRRTAAVARDGLNLAILAWMLLAAMRLWTDFRVNGAVALRDFATVYYALFFFIAQALAPHPASARLLRRALLGAVMVLPVTYFLFTHFEGFFMQTLQFRGVPLFFYKDDLAAAYFFAGFFLLMTVPDWPPLLRTAIAVAGYASAFAINSSRAAIMGLVVTSGWWAVARRWAPWKLQALVVPAALGALALAAALQPDDFKRSRVYTLYEHVASMVDFTGTGRYSSEDRRYVGDNNRFRLAWWRSVAEETWAGGPVFGLGFGYDLTERFVRTYELDLGEEFTTRSPHSVFFTVLGRMGLAGLAAFLAIIAAMAVRTARLARMARTDDAALPALGWWSVSWVMLVSGCFGVVLEGPMGAVVFWTALGMANRATTEMERGPVESSPSVAAEVVPEAAIIR